MSFAEMFPIFGKVIAEWSTLQSSQLQEPFLFLAHGVEKDPSALRVIVSDFNSNTFETTSRARSSKIWDDIGIGGSWSEFVDYTITSLGSSDVKLTLDGLSESREQASKCQLTKVLAAEREKSSYLQQQLDTVLFSRKGKSQKINGTDNSDSTSSIMSQDSPDKQASENQGAKRINRVVPAFRRSKVRGAVIEDVEDDTYN